MTHLHEMTTILDNAEATVDVCKICKEKFVYKKCRHTGRIDNRRYLKDHEIDFLQKGVDKLYDKYYPNKE